MDKDELYHAGWTHRKFFGARNGKSNQKQPRLDDPIDRDLEEQRQLAQGANHVNPGPQQADLDVVDAVMDEVSDVQNDGGSTAAGGAAAAM